MFHVLSALLSTDMGPWLFALAVGSTLPMGRNVQAGKQQAYNLDCVLYTHTAGQAELGLWLWGT